MSRSLFKVVLVAGLGVSALSAADFSKYRDLSFGTSLTAAAKDMGAAPSSVRTIQKRPALIQELDWQPRGSSQSVAKPESVRDGVLTFINGDLYRIVVTYDRYRIEGMTQDDLIDAISGTYGPATRPTEEIRFRSSYGETAAVLARWQDSGYSYDLVRTGDKASFALVMYSKRLSSVAEGSMVEAARLDKMEAPQRELDRQKKNDEDAQAVLEKNRAANKPNFKP